jgi:beta-glucosidase
VKCTKEYRLGYSEKAKAIVQGLSLEEKVWLMSGSTSLKTMMEDFQNPERPYNWKPYPAGGNQNAGIPPMLFCDGPRGVVTGKSTCFPVSMLRGATFDPALEERIGQVIGKEVRAQGGNLFGGVCINLPYNPGWGRSQEVYGEESFHLGAMGAALVRGVQAENVIACVKHYAFNSMERARFKVSVECDKRTEREVFLPHFLECVEAGAASVMSAYNRYQGTHCGHHGYLLDQVLKDEWDFDGFVMSDFGWGVRDTVGAAANGLDIEMCCTEFYGDKLVQAVRDGLVPEAKVDQAALRIVRTLVAFAEAGNKPYPKSLAAAKDHIALALETAEKGITLLKNEEKVLPLSQAGCKRIAVIGQLGNKGNIGDYGSSRVYPPYIVTPLEGIANLARHAEVIFHDGKDLAHAQDLARGADAVVLVVGYNHNDEGEFVSAEQVENLMGAMGGDRKSLALHDDEIELVRAVGPLNPRSVAVLIGGNTIVLNGWEDSVKAILMAYYPGMEGGTALAKILFGEVNPSGKLPFVLPAREADLPSVDWDADTQHYGYYHGYALLEKKGIAPRLPYGFGLSYTTFAVTQPAFGTDSQEVWARCTVTNTGSRAGDEVVQLYVGFHHSKVDRPVKLLRGFQRLTLKSGQSETVTLRCPVAKLRWYNPAVNAWELESMEYEVFIGTSSAPSDLLAGTVQL